MPEVTAHRGISYAVRRLGEQRWKWQIDPLACILGLRAQSGEVRGGLAEAVAAAQRAIDMQTGQYTQ